MSVEFWREHFKPRLKKVIDAIRAAQQQHVYIRYHSDGDIRLIIDDLIEIGVDILNPVQPECMPVDEVIATHRAELVLGHGWNANDDAVWLARDVRAVVAECARRAGRGRLSSSRPRTCSSRMSVGKYRCAGRSGALDRTLREPLWLKQLHSKG